MKTLTKIINKKEMTFSSDSDEKGEFYTLPVLSKQSKGGKEMRWKIIVKNIETDSFAFRSFHWQEPNGKVKESEWTIAQGKNIGKINETTSFDQALFQAYSQWQKKQEQQQYVSLDANAKMEHFNLNPMLANKYINQGKKYLKEPFAVSRKLDGIRAIGRLNDKGKIEMFTRNGKQIHHLHKVKSELQSLLSDNNIILDGELYSHSLSFNDITGAVRAQKNPSVNDDKIEYWVFDIVDINRPYLNRATQLRTIFNNQKNNIVVKFVDYNLCTHKEVKRYHDAFVQEGFEGLMARELQSKYEHARSNYLLKYKEFSDEEFEIVSITTGVGSEAGAIIFECKTENGALFTVRPRGTIEHRKLMYNNSNAYIGKRLTVRYQERDSITTIPRFPVGIAIRDYE